MYFVNIYKVCICVNLNNFKMQNYVIESRFNEPSFFFNFD